MDTLKFYITCRRELNSFRRKLGLPQIPNAIAERVCLRCQRFFRSFSGAHRVCDACKIKTDNGLYDSRDKRQS